MRPLLPRQTRKLRLLWRPSGCNKYGEGQAHYYNWRLQCQGWSKRCIRPVLCGTFGLGNRNPRGALVDFLNKEKIYCLNTFYQKHRNRKWTWRSPDNTVKNEIDYILATEKCACKDVSVLNRFDTGSDHRMVRASILINTRRERRRLTAQRRDRLSICWKRREINTTQIDKKLRPTEELAGLELNALSSKSRTASGLPWKKYARWRNRETREKSVQISRD